jgi:nucleoside-diphosphate-sugar epimerase
VTYLDDFARAFVALGESEEALGRVWHVPSPETTTMRRFVEMVFETAGHSPHLRAAPRWGIALAALFSPTSEPSKNGSTIRSGRGWWTAVSSSPPSGGSRLRWRMRSGQRSLGSDKS